MTTDLAPHLIPEHLRDFYTAPTASDRDYFDTVDLPQFEHYDTLGLGVGLPYLVKFYRQSHPWAREIVNADPRWAEYLRHRAEPWPETAPGWLIEAPLPDSTRSALLSTLQVEWNHRHRPDRPHPLHHLYEQAVMTQARAMTPADLDQEWVKRVGIPRAEQRSRQVADDRRRAEAEAAAAERTARAAASAHRQQQHDDLTAAATQRLDDLGDRLEADALERFAGKPTPIE